MAERSLLQIESGSQEVVEQLNGSQSYSTTSWSARVPPIQKGAGEPECQLYKKELE